MQDDRCHVEAGHLRQSHGDKLPRRHRQAITAVLHLCQPQSTVVHQRRFWTLSAGAGIEISVQAPYCSAGGIRRIQFLCQLLEFFQTLGLPGKFPINIGAHLDCANTVRNASLKQFDAAEFPSRVRNQPVGPVTGRLRVAYHSGQAIRRSNHTAARVANETELDGIERQRIVASKKVARIDKS